MVRKTSGSTDVADPETPETPETPEGSKATEEKRKYQRKAPLQPVPLDAIMGEDVPEDEWAANPVHVSDKPRDESQQKLDSEIGALVAKWHELGDPAPIKSPRRRYAVSPDHAPAMRFMIGQAATLHNVKPNYAPAAFDKDGREIIVVSPVPIPERKTRATKPATDTATDDGETVNGNGESDD